MGVGWGTKCLLQRGQVAKPSHGAQAHRAAGGHSGRRAVPLSLFPLVRERRVLVWAKQLPCPVPSPANQKGFDVCLKMKPRYANVFMMLAMFLQSSRKKRRHSDRSQIQEP